MNETLFMSYIIEALSKQWWLFYFLIKIIKYFKFNSYSNENTIYSLEDTFKEIKTLHDYTKGTWLPKFCSQNPDHIQPAPTGKIKFDSLMCSIGHATCIRIK